GTGGTAASAGALSSGPSSATGMRLVIGGKPYTGPAPRVIKGATMVPMMPFFQASPIGMSYDRATRRLIVLGRKTVVMWVGKTTATVDGARVPLATPPVLVGSEVYIPLRFTVETIGGELKWDAASKTMGVAFPAPQF
ncbi:copper amine oxidase N-terminal domain-containing protein, partial [bacterium]|nr:copper amine oxidase N-terminal domain-containing protein [bacterium]